MMSNAHGQAHMRTLNNGQFEPVRWTAGGSCKPTVYNKLLDKTDEQQPDTCRGEIMGAVELKYYSRFTESFVQSVFNRWR